jgi:hypothetical protein
VRSAGGRELRLVSHFPGRVRVRAGVFRHCPEVGEAVVRRVEEQLGVRSVSFSPATGSILAIYDPHTVQLPGIVVLIVAAAGLHGVAVDACAESSVVPSQGARVRSLLGDVNDRLRAASGGKVDLRTAVPGALVAGGISIFMFGRRALPQWYDLAFWAFVVFSNVNPVGAKRDSER